MATKVFLFGFCFATFYVNVCKIEAYQKWWNACFIHRDLEKSFENLFNLFNHKGCLMFHTSKTKLKNYSNTESQSEQQDPNREFKTLLKGLIFKICSHWNIRMNFCNKIIVQIKCSCIHYVFLTPLCKCACILYTTIAFFWLSLGFTFNEIYH